MDKYLLKTIHLIFLLGLQFNFSSCSSPSADGNNSAASVSEKTLLVEAREGFQDAGFYVEAGEEILIQSRGNWSGGQRDYVNSSTKTSLALLCDAMGCDGETLSFQYPFIPEEFNANDPTVPLNFIYLREPEATQIKRVSLGENSCGYLGGRLDGRKICFAEDGRLLGDNEPGIFNDGGWWRERFVFWRDVKNYAIASGDMNGVVPFLEEIVSIYENATCDTPPDINNLYYNMLQLRGASGGFLKPAETFFPIAHTFVMPLNNFKACCHEGEDTILEFTHGYPSSFITKNECATGTIPTNALVMKIVSSGERTQDVNVIPILNWYETETFKAEKSGYLYFASNDIAAGRRDNAGALEVTVKRAK